MPSRAYLSPVLEAVEDEPAAADLPAEPDTGLLKRRSSNAMAAASRGTRVLRCAPVVCLGCQEEQDSDSEGQQEGEGVAACEESPEDEDAPGRALRSPQQPRQCSRKPAASRADVVPLEVPPPRLPLTMDTSVRRVVEGSLLRSGTLMMYDGQEMQPMTVLVFTTGFFVVAGPATCGWEEASTTLHESFAWSPFAEVRSFEGDPLNGYLHDINMPAHPDDRSCKFALNLFAQNVGFVFATTGANAAKERASWVALLKHALQSFTHQLFPPFRLAANPLPDVPSTSRRLLAGYLLQDQGRGLSCALYCELHAHCGDCAYMMLYDREDCKTLLVRIYLTSRTHLSPMPSGTDCFQVDGTWYCARSIGEKELWYRALNNIQVKLLHGAPVPTRSQFKYWRRSVLESAARVEDPRLSLLQSRTTGGRSIAQPLLPRRRMPRETQPLGGAVPPRDGPPRPSALAPSARLPHEATQPSQAAGPATRMLRGTAAAVASQPTVAAVGGLHRNGGGGGFTLVRNDLGNGGGTGGGLEASVGPDELHSFARDLAADPGSKYLLPKSPTDANTGRPDVGGSPEADPRLSDWGLLALAGAAGPLSGVAMVGSGGRDFPRESAGLFDSDADEEGNDSNGEAEVVLQPRSASRGACLDRGSASPGPPLSRGIFTTSGLAEVNELRHHDGHDIVVIAEGDTRPPSPPPLAREVSLAARLGSDRIAASASPPRSRGSARRALSAPASRVRSGPVDVESPCYISGDHVGAGGKGSGGCGSSRSGAVDDSASAAAGSHGASPHHRCGDTGELGSAESRWRRALSHSGGADGADDDLRNAPVDDDVVGVTPTSRPSSCHPRLTIPASEPAAAACEVAAASGAEQKLVSDGAALSHLAAPIQVSEPCHDGALDVAKDANGSQHRRVPVAGEVEVVLQPCRASRGASLDRGSASCGPPLSRSIFTTNGLADASGLSHRDGHDVVVIAEGASTATAAAGADVAVSAVSSRTDSGSGGTPDLCPVVLDADAGDEVVLSTASVDQVADEDDEDDGADFGEGPPAHVPAESSIVGRSARCLPGASCRVAQPCSS